MLNIYSRTCQNDDMPHFESAYDDRAETFLQIGDVARMIAERHCDLTVDDVTHERWRELLGLLREVDTLADDTTIAPGQVIEKLDEFTFFAERYPALTPESLDAPVRAAMLQRVERILKLGQHIGRAETMQRFVALRTKEGRETAAFLSDTATPDVSAQPAFHSRFMPVMTSLAVTANLVDSMLDGRMDYKAEKIAHPPNGEFYRALGRNALEAAKDGFPAVYHWPVMGEFAIMSWNRLKNRMKHGGSATSSVHIFKG